MAKIKEEITLILKQ